MNNITYNNNIINFNSFNNSNNNIINQIINNNFQNNKNNNHNTNLFSSSTDSTINNNFASNSTNSNIGNNNIIYLVFLQTKICLINSVLIRKISKLNAVQQIH